MPESADQVYKSGDDIVADVLAAWATRIPDMELGEDSIARIWTEVFANTVEGLYLGQQLLHDDMFIQTANALALARFGEMFGRPQQPGALATGSVRFDGAGGTYVAQGTAVASPRPAVGDALIFETTEDGTIPDPGVPDAPTLADHGADANPAAGTYEYAITFLTDGGETELGTVSDPLIKGNAHSIDLSDISVGGPGTTGRNIYRRVDGGDWGLVDTLADNVTTVYNDANAATTTAPPDTSTAERITLTAQASDVGVDYNVAIGAITDLQDVNPGLSGVTNTVAFTGGDDEEDIETFRTELLKRVRAPQSGSKADLESWATDVDGVESATAFPNVDLAGAAAPGTVTVRISGPNGAIPDAGTVTAVQDYLDSKDLANITILVGTFTGVPVDVDVTIDLASGYTTADVEAQVTQAITDYLNSVPVGGTVYLAGIFHAVFGLAGVETLTITDPATDTVLADDEKATPGTITVGP